MLAGNEYLTSNTQIAYPFKEDAPGIGDVAQHGSVAVAPRALLVDALVFARDNVTAAYLNRIVATSPGLYTLVFADQYGNDFAQADVDTNVWADTYYQYGTWFTPGSSAVVKLVMETTSFLAYVTGISIADSFQMRLPLESTILNIKSPTVETLALYTALPAIPEPFVPGPISGRVKLISGYNTATVVAADETDADTAVVELAFTPSLGEGRVDCDALTPEFSRGLMELVPDEQGNVQFVPGEEACYSVIPYPSLGVLALHGNCKACCSCDDYENTALAIRAIGQKAKDLRDTLRVAHNNYYTPGVAHFNAIVAARYIAPELTVNAMCGAPWAEAAVRSGSSEWISITLGIKNNTRYPLTLTSMESDLGPPHEIRQCSWEYNGLGGQLAGTNLENGVPLNCPVIERGRSINIYILAYAQFPSDPSWSGTFTVECVDGGGHSWTLTDTLEVT